MPVNPRSKNCVGDELRRFKAGKMHSGKSGNVVKSKDQALAIALSQCGKSNFAQYLETHGFSKESCDRVSEMFSQINWDKQFETGTTGEKTKRENKTTKGRGWQNLDIDNRPGVQPGTQGKPKAEPGELLGPVSLPKGNPQPGPRSEEPKGMAAF